MHLKLKHITVLLSLLALTAGCERPTVEENDGKTPIRLSVGGIDSPDTELTRAVITDGTDKTLHGFTTSNTRLFLYVKSEDGNQEAGHTKAADLYALTVVTASANASGEKSDIPTPGAERQLYWDDAHARDSKLTVYACGYAERKTDNLIFGNNDKIYGGSNTPQKIDFRTQSIEPTVEVKLASQVSEKEFGNSDFIFSNNIADYHSIDGKTDDRLKFNTDPGDKYRKFDKGELIFYHAMSKLTFHVVMGEGFSESDFKFKYKTNIALKGFLGSGTFDLAQGEFTSTTLQDFEYISPENEDKDGNGNKLTLKTSTGQTGEPATGSKYYELKTYVVPGTDIMNSAVNDALTLIVNNSDYTVSMRTLYDKILENSANQQDASTVKESVLTGGTKLKAGVNYLFTITIGKAKIDNITAQVVDWGTVTADNIAPSNARIKLNLEERNNNDNSNVLGASDAFSIYRAADNNTGEINDDYAAYNWAKSYSNTDANLGWDSEHNCWSTSWYWDSNKHFYHFRALAKDNGSTKVAVSGSLSNDATYGDYYTLSHGETYNDILWGAPMLDKEQNENNDASTLKWNYGPDTKGFDSKDDGTVATGLPSGTQHQIYKAIGPTEDPIKLILFHMMSDVTFKVKTTSGTDAVNLGNGSTEKTTIELQKIHTSGKLFLGNGLVLGNTANVANSNYLFTNTPAPDGSGVITWANYGAIPQSLDDVVLVITTPDHNQYKVDMWDEDHPITAAVTSNNIANPYTESTSGKYKIDRWYPGFRYTYTFTLKKKGIIDLQATVVNWEEVTADNETVQIK